MASIPMTDALLDSASEAEDSSGVDTVSGDEGLEVLHVSGPAAVDAPAVDVTQLSDAELLERLAEVVALEEAVEPVTDPSAPPPEKKPKV